MSVKYLVLNILLCFLILFIAIENYQTWNRSADFLPDSGIVYKKLETKNENPPMMVSTKEPTSIQSINLISGKNIFTPERKDFPVSIVPAIAETQKTIVHPQVVLYGVTIADDYQSATVVNPGRPLRKDERETLTIKIGQKIGEYKLAKILPDRIVMENDGDNFEVLLYDPKNPRKRMEVRAEIEPAMIVSTQPALAPPPGEALKATPSQEPVEKPKEPVQAQAIQARAQTVASLPYNKYTYQLLGPSAAISRGRILDPASVTGPPAQESVEN